MIARFARKPVQKPKKIQPDCPVRLYSYVCSVEERSRTSCVQMRFVNCSEREVESLFLRICGLGVDGTPCYRLDSVPLAQCAAAPRSVFGEERLIFLPSDDIGELEITVEWVLFSDGMIWKRLSGHLYECPEAMGMVQCTCGMWNGTEAAHCDFCGKTTRKAVREPAMTEEEQEIEPLPLEAIAEVCEAESEDDFEQFSLPDLGLPEFESLMQETAFVLRSMQEDEPFPDDEEEEEPVLSEKEFPFSGNRGIGGMLIIILVLVLLTGYLLYQKGYFG